MNRREFVASLGAAGIGSSFAFASQKKELFEISLAQWSLHKAIFGKKMDAGDFPKVTKEEFGINAVEYVNQFYKDKKKDDGYVKELRKKCDDLNVKSVLIMCDGEGQLGDADEKKRKLAVENHYRWVEWAKTLGCHSIRVNAGSSGSYEEQMNRASDGLRMLSEWAGKMQINVIVENHLVYPAMALGLLQPLRRLAILVAVHFPTLGISASARMKNTTAIKVCWN